MIDKVNVNKNPAPADFCSRDFACTGLFLERDGMDLKKGSGGL
jgi:hypothetical protein